MSVRAGRPLRRGWCPSLFEPMGSGDGLLTRIKPPLGRLSAAAARALASAVREFGNGQMELTNRAALQVRGLSERSLRAFQDAVAAAELASADPAVERRRNLVVSPFASPAGAALAEALEHWISDDETLAGLPSKFGFAVAAPDRDPLPLAADLCFAPGPDGCLIYLAGAGVAGATETPLIAAQAIVRRFLELRAAFEEGPVRMADLVRRCGREAIVKGVDLARRVEPAAFSPSAPAIAGAFTESFALGLAFGAFTVDQLATAANLAERYADGWLRLSPWRALVMAQVADVSGLTADARAAGFIVDPADPRLMVSACPGAPACASAHRAVRTDAALLASDPLPSHVHVSGCAKGCAHPARTGFTLVAAPDGYGLVRDGRAGDPPEARGLTLEAAVRLLAAETQ